MNNNCSTRSKLLRKVQEHCFALTEANLYLNGHPHCQKALNYFACQKALYDKYVAEYEKMYGPLTALASKDCDNWNWVQGPWPWESEAN